MLLWNSQLLSIRLLYYIKVGRARSTPLDIRNKGKKTKVSKYKNKVYHCFTKCFTGANEIESKIRIKEKSRMLVGLELLSSR